MRGNIPDHGDALADDVPNGWQLQQSLWEDWLESAAEDSEGEGDEFCDNIFPRSQKKMCEGRGKIPHLRM